MSIKRRERTFRTYSVGILADLRPHLHVQTMEEMAGEERRAAARAASGSNSVPLLHVDERKGTSAKRLSSPERFEIKQLIASGAVSASEVFPVHQPLLMDHSIPTWTMILALRSPIQKSRRTSTLRLTRSSRRSYLVRQRSR